MSQPQDVLKDVAAAINEVSGLRAHATTPGTVQPPAAVCEIATVTGPASFDGLANYTVRVVLLVQLGDQRNSQERTLTLIDPTGPATTSVFAALLAHDPVGQVSFEGPGLVDHGGQQYAGGIFTVEVYV